MNYPYGKTILITGAGSGIGKAAAELFAQNGFTVYGVSRSCSEQTTAYGKGTLHTKPMDVTDEQSVQRVVEGLEEIGIVLHCAGFGIGGSAEDTPMEQVRQQFETNYFGVLTVNRYVLPKMRKQGRGLVLVMSSVAGQISIPFQSHYSSSKYALEAYLEALRMECGVLGIKAALIEPGDTKTAFTGARKTYNPPHSPYFAACQAAIAQMEQDERKGKDPKTAAEVALKLAQCKNPPIRKVVGFDYSLLMLLKRLLPASTIEYILKRIYLRDRNN